MKRLLLSTILVFAVGLMVEANAQDRTDVMQVWVKDSIKTGAIDTIRVTPLSNTNVAFYQVTAWAGADDTLDVAMLVPDGSRYIPRAVVNLSSGVVSNEMIVSTTPKDFVVMGGLTSSLEFTSPGSTNAIYFIVSGRVGQLALASPITLTLVGTNVIQDSLDALVHKKDTLGVGVATYMTTARSRDSLDVKIGKKDTVGITGATYTTTARQRDSLAKYTSLVTFAADTTYDKAQRDLWSADTSVFTTTALQKAVYIAGCLQGDIFVVTPRYLAGATPVAGDLLSYWAKPDSLIVTRAVGTTSGLKFSWIRKTK